jgi:hypothetical protein
MKSALLIFCLFSSSFLFAQDKQMVFRNRKDSSKIFSIRMADEGIIKMKDGKKKTGIISSYTDSTICFKEARMQQNLIKIRAIWQDKSLTREQKQAAVLKTAYPDSVNIAYESIKKIKFWVGGDKQYKSQVMWAGILMLTTDLFFIASFTINDSYANHPDAGPPPFIATRQAAGLGLAAIIGSLVVYRQACEKNIYTRDWKLKIN